MLKKLWNTKLTANDSTQMEELGVIREEYDTTYGLRRFVYVQAAADTTVAAGTACGYSDRKKATVSSDVANWDFLANQVAGVGIGAITAEYYGWLQCYGYHGGVNTDGGDDITDGMLLILDPSTDGTVDSLALGTAATYKPVGVAVADDIDGDNKVSAFLDC